MVASTTRPLFPSTACLVDVARLALYSGSIFGGAANLDYGLLTAAVLAGVHIVRVHAVGEMVQVVRVAEEIRRRIR